jgi:hypothetical protein
MISPRDIFRGVFGPMLGGVECDDANWVVVLPASRSEPEPDRMRSLTSGLHFSDSGLALF